MTALQDLRKYPRIRLLRPFYGQFVEVRELFALRDVSSEGFSVVGPVQFAIGATHSFKFALHNRELLLDGTAKHCRPLNSGSDGPLYLAGFEFLPGAVVDLTAFDTAVAVDGVARAR